MRGCSVRGGQGAESPHETPQVREAAAAKAGFKALR